MNVLHDPDTGDRLIERDGIIVARIPRIVEDKWPGITCQMASAAPLAITMSVDQGSAEVQQSRDGDLCWLALKPTERSLHQTAISLIFDDPVLADDIAELIQKGVRRMTEKELLAGLQDLIPQPS